MILHIKTNRKNRKNDNAKIVIVVEMTKTSKMMIKVSMETRIKDPATLNHPITAILPLATTTTFPSSRYLLLLLSWYQVPSLYYFVKLMILIKYL